MAAERKGKKLRRCTAKSRAYYSLQVGKSEANKKRRLKRHIRTFPMDVQAIVRYEKDMGRANGLGMNSQGRRNLARAGFYEITN